MTTYGPLSGIAAADLFDTIVNNIDANRSGNATGWDIVRDCRSAARVPSDPPSPNPVGFVPTARLDGGRTLYATRGLVSTFRNIVHLGQPMFISGPDYWILPYTVRNASGTNQTLALEYFTTTNFSTFAGPFTANISNTPLGQSGRTFAGCNLDTSGRRMLLIQYGDLTTGFIGSSRTLFLLTNAADPMNTATPNAAAGVSSAKSAIANTMLFGNYVHRVNDTTIVAFYSTSANYTGVSLNRFTCNSSGQITDHSSTTVNTPTAFASAASLGVLRIFGIYGVENKGSYYEVLVGVEHTAGVYKVIRCKTAGLSFEVTNALSVVNNDYTAVYTGDEDFITQAGILATAAAGAEMVPTENTVTLDVVGTAGYIESDDNTLTVIDSQKFYFRAKDAGVSGLPDFNGLQYEYVVFQSQKDPGDGDGYFMTLLRPDPNQVSPPTVTGITNKKPIFLRPTRNFAGNVFDRFRFDPVVPTAIQAGVADAYFPALESIPNTGITPEETHKLWMRVTEDQVFVFTESSSAGTSQYLHYNILDPIFPMSDTAGLNDNVCVAGAGNLKGAGVQILGFNGYSESSFANNRASGRTAGPVGALLSYNTVLTGNNTVDNNAYGFKITVGTNPNALASAATPNFDYVAGYMKDSLNLPGASAVSSGDAVTIGGVPYKAFKATSTASTQNNAILNNLLVKW